jgi:hypothetical protein
MVRTFDSGMVDGCDFAGAPGREGLALAADIVPGNVEGCEDVEAWYTGVSGEPSDAATAAAYCC